MLTLTASIFSDMSGDSTLNLVFAAALFVGLVYSVFLLFFHGIGEAFGDLDIDLDLDVDADIDLDVDHAGEAAGVSMLAVASFISAFGAFGLIAVTLFEASAVGSLITALLSGLVMGIAAQAFFVYILSPTVSSNVQQTSLIGLVGEITTPIPANGTGQIAFVAKGSRMTYSARSTDETLLVGRGTPVRIERIVGGVAFVSKID
ncbi:MAG: NfeD family protein [Anaerolineae bacterium]|jgi:membrane protein implicated in regulation of membrane protease activity|nr:NfeD family protein [Anaerolineae bacterium]